MLVLIPLCAIIAHAEPARTPDQIIAEYEATTLPRHDPSRDGDDSYGAQFLDSLEAARRKRNDLAAELWQIAPEHPKALEMMNERWKTIAGSGKSRLAVLEIDQALVQHPNDQLTAELKLSRAETIFYGCTNKEFLDAVEQFIAAAPTDKRGVTLLMRAAERPQPPAEQIAIYRRIIKDYPESASAGRAEGKIHRIEGVGKTFDLSFTDAISGNSVSIDQFKGQIVVIDFWATWCGPCVAEMPQMKQLHAKYKNEGVQFIGVSLDNPENQGGLEKLKAFVSTNQIDWPQYYQGTGWDSAFSKG
ncbi:MAG: redoxin domain-containing protein, partial [Tepidisphaeraceae bacterium]